MGSTSIAEVKAQGSAVQALPDQAVDMFTERGFALANRIAKAFATSDAVPSQFRLQNLKKAGSEEHWVENQSAIGNCLVAIEVARAVQMSITAVMQNADMINGKLRWSGKFVIAAINASGRFTPLRFQMRNLGNISAKYKEKTGWDNQARRPVFTERSVEVENTECIAWALPKGTPEPRPTVEQMREYRGRTLDMYRDFGLPVIESAPVTMRMVVEEGWYGKADSKWQTEMRALMFQYRAGSFFGNIHAPDVVMGMSRTTEEERDLAPTFDIGDDGSVTPTPIDQMRPPAPGPVPMAEVVDKQTGEITGPASSAEEKPEAAQASSKAAASDKPASEWTPTPEEEAEIRKREMAEAGQDTPAQSAAPASRRTRSAQQSIE